MTTNIADTAATLREIARLHVRAQRRLLAEEDGRSTTCTILTELGRAPSMTLAELSARLRIDKGWVSRAVERLFEDGLVRKKIGTTDRRTVMLSLTASGQREHGRLESLLDGQVRRIIGRIAPAERATVSRVLQQLLASYGSELEEQDER
jgi:DNA-binding MarR family transcriptional regulator